jgi:hypothetical protein
MAMTRRIARTARGGIAFHRRDGRPIEACRARGRPARLPSTRRPDACVALSHDRLDLGYGVEALLTFAPIATGEPPGI